MSDEKKSSEHLTDSDDTSTEVVDTSTLGSTAQTTSNKDQEELPAGAAGYNQHEMPEGATGISQEGFPSSALVINQEGFPPYVIRQEELAGVIESSQESSAAGGAVPKVVLGMEEVQEAFLANARDQLQQFQTIKDELVTTIKELKQHSRRNPGNWVFFERLREHIKDTYVFLNEIKEAVSIQEAREEYLNFQMNQFFERRKEEGDNFKGTTIRLGTIDGVDVTIETAERGSGEENDDTNVDKSKIAKALVGTVLISTMMQPHGQEADEEPRLEAAAAGIGVERPPNDPHGLNVADVNVGDEDDDGVQLGPLVTGRYTLAIRAHELFPESSSEDSPTEELDQYPQGEERNVLRRDNEAMEERMAGDRDSRNNSPAGESSHQL